MPFHPEIKAAECAARLNDACLYGAEGRRPRKPPGFYKGNRVIINGKAASESELAEYDLKPRDLEVPKSLPMHDRDELWNPAEAGVEAEAGVAAYAPPAVRFAVQEREAGAPAPVSRESS